MHPPLRAVTILVRIFSAILLVHHFPSLWKTARVTPTGEVPGTTIILSIH